VRLWAQEGMAPQTGSEAMETDDPSDSKKKHRKEKKEKQKKKKGDKDRFNPY